MKGGTEARAAVWDASALLAILLRERGWQQYAQEMIAGSINAVNLSEVATRLLALGGSAASVREVLGGLPLRVCPFSEEIAYRAANLRASTASLGLSLGDRACLAQALELNLPALTADRIWSRLDLAMEVVLIR